MLQTLPSWFLLNHAEQVPEGVRILRVAATLRAALGLGKANVPDEVSTWVKEHGNLDYRSLVPDAVAKLRRVLAE